VDVISAGQVLVVCTGNVCRSPYIERRLRHDLAGAGIAVSSAGTRALVGHDMDAGTRNRLRNNGGGDIGAFAARQLTSDLVRDADLVLTAAREHRAVVVRLHPAALARTFTLRDLADLLSEVSADELADAARTDDSDSWVRRVSATASRRRGLVPARQQGVDVTDPIGGPPSLFARMAAEVDDALPPVVRALRQVPDPFQW
jgi:protein-tyrosine phosphatase